MPIETKRYMILFEGNEYPIIMPNIYSTEKFEKEFTYSGSDLGATYTPENYNAKNNHAILLRSRALPPVGTCTLP